MKVERITSPSITPIVGSTTNTAVQAEARARAIAKLQGNEVVRDQNNISPEEVGAVKTATSNNSPSIEATTQSQTEIPVETKSEAKPETKAPELSEQHAALIRREKALRAQAKKQEQDLRTRQDALKAKEQELAARDKQYEGYISRQQLKDSTLQALAEAGVSYDEVVQQVLNQTPKDPRVEASLNELKNEIKALRQQNEDFKKGQQESQSQQYQAAVKQIRTDVRSLITQDPTYETIKATNSVNDVVELITQTYDKDGVLMTVEEAALEVENYLVEEATKLAKIDKIRRRLNPQVQASGNTEKTQSKQQQQMKTLTNATASTRKLSSRERALLAFKGELKA